MDFPYLVFCLYYHKIPSRYIMGNLSNHKFANVLLSPKKFLLEKTYALVIKDIGII